MRSRLQSTLSLATTGLVLLICLEWQAQANGPLVAQSTSDRPSTNPAGEDLPDQDDLPEGAVWRFGDHGRPLRSNGIYRMEVSPLGKRLALRNQDNRVLIVDTESQQLLWEFEGHEGRIRSLSFTPDGETLVTAAGPGEPVKFWDTRTGKLAAKLDTVTYEAYFNSLGSRVYLLGETHVETYSWPEKELRTKRRWRNNNEQPLGLSSDGKYVAMYKPLARDVYQTLVIDLATRTKVQLAAPTSQPRSVAFSADRNWIAIAYNRDPRTRLWDLRAPHSRKYALAGHDNTVQALAFTHDSRYLLTGSWDDSVILWDVVSQQKVSQRKGHAENVTSVADADQPFRFLSGASGRMDSSVMLWDYRDQVQLAVNDPLDDFEKLWEQLGHRDYFRSMTEVSRIVQEAERWLPAIDRHTREVTQAQSSGSLDELIEQLASPTFEVRERATERLIKIRVQADSELRIALEETTSPEVKARLTRILRIKIQRPPRDEVQQRRWLRLIFALEQINSPTSQSILQRISEGHPDIDLSRDANAAFQRNDAHSPSNE